MLSSRRLPFLLMLILGLGSLLLAAQVVSARTSGHIAVKQAQEEHTAKPFLGGPEEITEGSNRTYATEVAEYIKDCIACHKAIRLEEHDRLGVGTSACLVCHDRRAMLRFVNGTTSPLEASSELCAQCHGERYNAWKEATHGVPGQPGVKCTECHSPHAPQIAPLNITEPHPPPIPSPSPAPPIAPFAVFAIALAIAIIVGLRIR